MLAQFTLIPIATKTDSLSDALTESIKLIINSGLNYKAGPMGTTVEGEWNEIINLINRCRKQLLKNHSRVSIHITIDDRKNSKGRIEGKITSLEKKIGKKLKQ